ncbi:MAG: lysophospholipase [Anaerolineales bacterium]|nr:lysophospholipase [Anaerolineales bacterium]MDW8227669.1 alpha/beta fold hydrolase [Anaerolineales bacterium]
MLPFTPFTSPEHRDFTLISETALGRSGDRPAALLVHGYPGTPYEMRPLAEALYARGWTCRGILLPGFGAQIETLPQRRWTEWREAVIEALVALRRDHAPLLLIGHSMGGAVALTAAACLPVDGLILLAPYWRRRGVLWALLPVLKHLFPRVKPFHLMKTELDDPRLLNHIRDFLPEVDLTDPQTIASIRDFEVPVSMFDELRKIGMAGWHAAPKVACPTLIIQGSEDVTVHPEDTCRLAQRLRGPVRRLEVRAAHELVFAESSAFPQVREVVLEFAAQILVESNYSASQGKKYGASTD